MTSAFYLTRSKRNPSLAPAVANPSLATAARYSGP